MRMTIHTVAEDDIDGQLLVCYLIEKTIISNGKNCMYNVMLGFMCYMNMEKL